MVKKIKKVEKAPKKPKAPLQTQVTILKKFEARIEERLQELGCDPLELMVKVAKGEELTTNHPFLKRTIQFLIELRHVIENDVAINPDMLDQFEQAANGMLRDIWTPIELRAKMMVELTQYVYPKKKASDPFLLANPNGGTTYTEDSNRPLNEREIKEFNKYFNFNY